MASRSGSVGVPADPPARARDGQRPTLLDVARVAGVARTTASDAIQGRGRIAPATRERVLAAVAQLGYRAHIGARDMRRRRTEIVGVVVGDLFDPFCAELTAHLERGATARGYRVLLATAGSDLAGEASAIDSLMAYRAAAIILISFTGDESALQTAGGHTPVVCLGYEGPYGISIGIDDRRGGELGTAHLVELGHRHIAYLSSSGVPRKTDRERRAGYRRALRRGGIEPDPEIVLRVAAGPEAERFSRVHALLSGPQRPTAVFAVSDITAMEVIACASELGLRVPQDLSVVGFDGIALARMPMIALTTVAQPIAELARCGVETAIGQIEDPHAEPHAPRIEPRLVVRGTTAPPPG